MMDTLKNKIIQLKFQFYDIYRTYILKQKDCDNCAYFGGLMCDHIDENGKCLGWKKIKFNPLYRIKDAIHIHKVKKMIKKINKELKELD